MEFSQRVPSNAIDRRRFVAAVAAAGTGGGAVSASSAATGSAVATQAAPARDAWKVDITVFDRPGWSATSFGLPVMRHRNGDLVVGFQAQREDAITDDFYSAHAEWIFLTSANGGRSWKQTGLDGLPLDVRWPERSAHCTNGWAVQPDESTLINVVEMVPNRQQQKQRLEELGLGHLWFPDSTFGWDLWPASHAERLKQEGIYVFDHKGPWLPEGVVATHDRQPAVTISRDGGRTWEERQIEGLPRFSRYSGWFRRGVVLDDGTVVGAIYGTIQLNPRFGASGHDSTYALRSTDAGRTWEMSTIAHDETEKIAYNEADLLALPSGRVLAVIRGGGKENLYQSYSDDGGKNWSPVQPTGIAGSPANLLRLRNGNILCVYRCGGYPAGYRGVFSRDDGQTWDVENEIVICDDTLPGLVGYPSSVELDDGTIFTLYNVMRVGALKPQDSWGYKQDLLIRPPLHSYIAGSIYTESYTRPLG